MSLEFCLSLYGVFSFIELEEKRHNLVPEVFLALVLYIRQIRVSGIVIRHVISFSKEQSWQTHVQEQLNLGYFQLLRIQKRFEQFNQLMYDYTQSCIVLLFLILILELF